jgi:hypothetical protein
MPSLLRTPGNDRLKPSAISGYWEAILFSRVYPAPCFLVPAHKPGSKISVSALFHLEICRRPTHPNAPIFFTGCSSPLFSVVYSVSIMAFYIFSLFSRSWLCREECRRSVHQARDISYQRDGTKFPAFPAPVIRLLITGNGMAGERLESSFNLHTQPSDGKMALRQVHELPKTQQKHFISSRRISCRGEKFCQ